MVKYGRLYEYIISKEKSNTGTKEIWVCEKYRMPDGIEIRKTIFPYDSDWWEKQDNNLKNRLEEARPVSKNLDEALEKAKKYFEKVRQDLPPENELIMGRIDHLLYKNDPFYKSRSVF